MNRTHPASLSLTLALASALAMPTVTCGGEVRVDGRAFTLPDGFEVERVAGPPLVVAAGSHEG